MRIHASHVASGYNYGSPRVYRDLKAAGTRVARKRVARIMRESELQVRTRRRVKVTTDSSFGAINFGLSWCSCPTWDLFARLCAD